MPTVTIQEAQATLSDLIHRLTPGEEVVITENDQPVARLVPATRTKPKPDVRQVIEELKAFSKGNRLGDDVTIRELIEDGRRF